MNRNEFIQQAVLKMIEGSGTTLDFKENRVVKIAGEIAKNLELCGVNFDSRYPLTRSQIQDRAEMEMLYGGDVYNG